MIALAQPPAPAEPRPLRAPRVTVEDAPTPSLPAPAAAVWPANDRLPLAKKVHILAERGLWPALEAVAKQHGWHSVETARYIDAHLPKAPCPICGTPFYAYSRRVLYCSDSCRRAFSVANEQDRERVRPPRPPKPSQPATPAPEAGYSAYFVAAGGGRHTRRYAALLTVDLLGVWTLLRMWQSWKRSDRWQHTTTTYASQEAAEAALAALRATLPRRGYRETKDREGRIAAASRAIREGERQ